MKQCYIFLLLIVCMSNVALASADYSKDELKALSQKLNSEAESVMRFWLEHGPDVEHGGFHGTLDRDGTVIEPSDKGLIQQSRHLWSLSMWYQRRDSSEKIKTLADASFKFIVDHYLDEDGEFYFKVSANGNPVDKKKLLYAESFAIYGLAQYAISFNHDEAKRLALACFKSMDARAHDSKYLGYDQSNDPGWLAQGAQKGTNTQIHILEALTTLYSATADELVGARLQEMIDVITTKVIQKEGYAHLEFYRDWRPHQQQRVSYGHDLETLWLVVEAYKALNKPIPSDRREILVSFADNASRWGFDEKEGAYYNYGVPAGEVEHKEKIWWVQAEAFAGLWQLYELTGDSMYLVKLEKTLDWSLAQLKDSEHGAWFSSDNKDADNANWKGYEWKTNYHLIRGLVYAADWISDDLKTKQEN